VSFLKDGKGASSSTRLVMVCWAFGILIVWIGVCIYTASLVDIPLGVGAVLGYIMGGKAIQSFAEVRESKSDQ